MKDLLSMYLVGCLLAAYGAIRSVCENPKSVSLAELAFILMLTIFSWSSVLALNIGYNAKRKS